MDHKSSKLERFELMKENNITPDMLTLEYNVNHTRAKVVLVGGNIQVSYFMKEENARKLIEEYRKFYYKVKANE